MGELGGSEIGEHRESRVQQLEHVRDNLGKPGETAERVGADILRALSAEVIQNIESPSDTVRNPDADYTLQRVIIDPNGRDARYIITPTSSDVNTDVQTIVLKKTGNNRDIYFLGPEYHPFENELNIALDHRIGLFHNRTTDEKRTFIEQLIEMQRRGGFQFRIDPDTVAVIKTPGSDVTQSDFKFSTSIPDRDEQFRANQHEQQKRQQEVFTEKKRQREINKAISDVYAAYNADNAGLGAFASDLPQITDALATIWRYRNPNAPGLVPERAEVTDAELVNEELNLVGIRDWHYRRVLRAIDEYAALKQNGRAPSDIDLDKLYEFIKAQRAREQERFEQWAGDSSWTPKRRSKGELRRKDEEVEREMEQNGFQLLERSTEELQDKLLPGDNVDHYVLGQDGWGDPRSVLAIARQDTTKEDQLLRVYAKETEQGIQFFLHGRGDAVGRVAFRGIDELGITGLEATAISSNEDILKRIKSQRKVKIEDTTVGDISIPKTMQLEFKHGKIRFLQGGAMYHTHWAGLEEINNFGSVTLDDVDVVSALTEGADISATNTHFKYLSTKSEGRYAVQGDVDDLSVLAPEQYREARVIVDGRVGKIKAKGPEMAAVVSEEVGEFDEESTARVVVGKPMRIASQEAE